MNQVTRKRIFFEEFLPPIVATIIGLIIFIVLLNLNLSYTSPAQELLFIIICWIPAIFFVITAGKIRLPPAIKIGVYVFATLSNMIATTFNVYAFVPVFDTILHSGFGYLCGYLLLYVFIYFSCSDKISFLPKCIFILLITAGIGIFWEVIEYCCDVFSKVNSQHGIEEGLLDTMQDTFCNLGGACLFQVHLCIDHTFFQDKIFKAVEKHFSIYLDENKKPQQILFLKK